ncbi:sigma-70 family RNA polymerase sigma factor [Paraflavitalea speifideaquila]|uniref:sigma-70 family RNA polymerase sigma factor n=1 Tax=Paraflavitalea speifideaquila TaxID=3076558 RepID=UPI0028ED0F27|nr:sigma-70 family RNA polymerase sigma factor [Paraflavitalea speifideiaquila]
MYRFILKNLRHEEDARDVVQTAFEKMWVNRAEVDGAKCKSYLFTVAYNQMIDHLRKAKRISLKDEFREDAKIYDRPMHNTRKVLEVALAQLNETQRSLVLLKDYEGYSYEEIGQITGLTESQVKVYLHRARVQLKIIWSAPKMCYSMNITRHNYEEFFLLYVDNELNIAQRKAVETFVEENPDLRPELIMLQQSVLPADEKIVFSNKQSLLKSSAAPNPVNETNCEEYFVLYADDELTNEQKDQVEQFVYRHPQHQAAFELMQQARLMPDTAIIFPNKYALYRSEEDDKAPVVRMRWWKIAAAAAVLLLIGGSTWYTLTREGNNHTTTDGQYSVADKPKANQLVPQIQEPSKAPLAATDPGKTNQAADLAVINDQVSKKQQKNTTVKPVVILPVKDNKQEEFAGNNRKEEKNNNKPGNILTVPNVPQTGNDVEDSATSPVRRNTNAMALNNTIKIDPTNTPNVNVPVREGHLSSGLAKVTTYTPEREVEMEPDYAVNTDNKKNKMRGFFRKVSRVFDKATHADNDNEKSIRIASFEFALK